MQSIYNLTKKELEEYFLKNGEKKFHADQLFSWLYQKKVKSFDSVTDIKKDFISVLKQDFEIKPLKLLKKESEKDVNKYLFLLDDNEAVESVLMRHDYGNSICISTQVGCNMGCAFCESGRRKKVRDLTVSEMVRQVLMVEEDLEEKITHIVIMGIGEPFDNYDNVIKFLQIMNDPKALAIGSRHMTVSTCGIIPKIKEFSDFPLQVNLAISLHAPREKLRSSLMKINKVYPLKDLIPVLKEYTKKTNRRLTFEYILLDKINDQESDAKDLVKLIKGMNAYVNLIPYNYNEKLKFNRSKPVQIMKFYDILKKNHIQVTIRREFGSNISAACGQLRSKKEEI